MIHSGSNVFPLYTFAIGSKDPLAAVMFILGGVHGIERIGAQLAWSFLKTLLKVKPMLKMLKLLMEYMLYPLLLV